MNTPSSRTLRKTGLIRDQEGIYSRYLREKKSWEAHLSNTRDFLLNCFNEKPQDSIAVLGSGWCLDVPVEELAKRFSKVYLIDLRHPRLVRSRYKKITNLKFINTDLTGGMIELAYQLVKKGRSRESIIKTLLAVEAFELPVDAEHIASVNLLNQLDILLVDYLRGQLDISPGDLLPLRKSIQEKHIALLRLHKGCLISDYEEIQLNARGDIINRTKNVFAELPASKRSSRWTWEFDNHRTYHPDYHTHLNVIAMQL